MSNDQQITVSPAARSRADQRYRNIVFEGVVSRPLPRPVPPLKPGLTSTRRGADERSKRAVETPIEPAVEAFLRQVFMMAGLGLERYRPGALVRRIPACLRQLRVGSIEAAADALARDPSLLDPVLNALLIGVSNFFRDTPVFEHLRQQIIPDLVHRRIQPRIWSMACSDGMELYSVAMLFAEENCLSSAEFYGTDCRAAAIELAKRASYPADRAGEIPPSLRNKYLMHSPASMVVCPELRRAIRWDVQDIFHAPVSGQWDLILCRNLAIYLEEPAGQALWTKLTGALARGGIVMVGKAERPITPELRRVGPCLYRKG